MDSKPETTNDLKTKRPLGLVRLRRFLLVLIGLITLIAAFYAEEDWRGKRAWEKCKNDIESKGYVLDWSAYIPPSIPDDQNFFKAPHMSDWMTGRGSREISKAFNFPKAHPDVVIAEIKVVQNKPADAALNPDDLLVQLNDPNIVTNVAKFIEKLVGPTTTGALNWTFVARLPNSAKPSTIFIQSEKPVSGQDIATLFGNRTVFYGQYTRPGDVVSFRIESTGPDSFRLFSNGLHVASDFLAWSETVSSQLDPIREALKRPYARMDGNYDHPFDVPIPNFVVFRQISQLLSDRAKLYLLENKPDQALEQLTFIHNLCHVLEARPGGKPITLVAAMINVAIQGLYTSTIAEGVHNHKWQESQLVALQQQLSEVNVFPFVDSALNGERVSMCRVLQMPKAEVADVFTRFLHNDLIAKGGSIKTNFWDRWTEPFYVSVRLAPRGWLYQNMVIIADAMQPVVESFNLDQSQIAPHRATAAMAGIENRAGHRTPYNLLALIGLPNFSRAMQTAAKNQSYINLAYIACGLERYHLVHNEYPETLDALVPRFADHIPADIINGQPLHYHRTDDGQFKLYSVGWNEKDDGGVPGKDTEGTGDWLWTDLF